MTDEPVTRGRLFLISAPSEDTAAAVALALGHRLPRCLVVAGSQMDAMLVSGRAPADDVGLEGVRHRLLRWSACLAAAETYQLEGFDAVVVGNQYHYLRTDGRVFRETIGVHSDAGVRIRLRLETAWIHMTEQLQGFQRFWFMHLLGTWRSPHQLGIQYQTDYTPGWTDAWWYDATGLTDSTGWITGSNAAPIGVDPITGSNYGDGVYGGTTPDLYEWRLHLNEKGKSIQFRYEDFEAEGYADASFELTEMLLTGGVIAPAQRPWTAARSA